MRAKREQGESEVHDIYDSYGSVLVGGLESLWLAPCLIPRRNQSPGYRVRDSWWRTIEGGDPDLGGNIRTGQ